MSLLPEIERELLRAARGLPAADQLDQPASQERRRSPRLVSALTVTVSAVVVAIVVVGALFALHHGAPSQQPAVPRPSFPGAPHTQPGQWGQGGNLCPLAARSRYLPKRAGCVTVRHADVDGDGRPDLVLLYGRLGTRRYKGEFVPMGFELQVLRASGGSLAVRIAHPEQAPVIVSVANVNHRPGDEIFIQQSSISSGSYVGVYTFNGRRLVSAGGPQGGFAYGGDSAQRYGYVCRAGPRAAIVQHTFILQGGGENGRWQRTDTTYQWVGARLQRTTKTTTQTHGYPPKQLTVAGC